jgi:hypothetical protein
LLKSPHKALHRTAIPLRSIAAGELVRSGQKAGIMTIKDLVDMGSGMKPVISPMNLSFQTPPKSRDIHFISG